MSIHNRLLYALSIFSLTFLVSCPLFSLSYNYKMPVMKKEDRDLYIVDHGWNLRTEHKLAFVEGQIVSGMPLALVFQLYGSPDLSTTCGKGNEVCDGIWQYSTNNDKLVGSVSFKQDTVVKATGQLSRPCKF